MFVQSALLPIWIPLIFNAVNVSPQIVENYDGESTIPLDKEGKIHFKYERLFLT